LGRNSLGGLPHQVGEDREALKRGLKAPQK
jgi:hypothetical protein